MSSKFFTLLYFILYFSFFIFFQCDPEESSSSSSVGFEILSDDRFYFRQGVNAKPEIIDFLKIAENDAIEIFIDKNLKNELIAQKGNEIISKFKNKIIPIGNQYFGFPSDVDKNGKVTVFIVNLYQRYLDNGGNSKNPIYTVGFFNPNETLFDNREGYNLKDSLFMDSHIFKVNESQFYETLIHEYQHLINWNERVLKSPNLFNVPLNTLPHEVWLNEALSVSAEHLYNNGFLNKYIKKFSNSYPSFLSAITSGDKFITWNKSEQLANYATAYLFIQWIRIHSDNGHGIYKKLINNQKDNGIPAIVNLVKSEISLLKASDWSDILKAWNITFYFNRGITGNKLYSYNGEVTFSGFVTSGVNQQKLSLYPGESILMEHYNRSGNNISVSDLRKINDDFLYVSIKESADNGLIIDDSSQDNYKYLLVINKSTNVVEERSFTIPLPNSSQQQIDYQKQSISKQIPIYSKKKSAIHAHGGVIHQHISQEQWLKKFKE